MCHQNIDCHPDKSLVVSTASATGKTGMKGCNQCSNKSAKSKQLCSEKKRHADFAHLINYIRFNFSGLIATDAEFKSFLKNEASYICEWVSVPVEVIYDHPIWIAHGNRLPSRSMLNRRFQKFIDWALKHRTIIDGIAQMCERTYGQYFYRWRERVKESPGLKDIYNYHDLNKAIEGDVDKGISPKSAGNHGNPNIDVIIDIGNFARLARNVSEHHEDETVAEESLEEAVDSFRTFMYTAMVKYKTDFADWNLEKIT